MNESRSIGDMELNAYLDGELESSARAEVESWLADHPDDAARLAVWRRHKEALAGLSAEVLAEPAPPALARILSRAGQHRWPRWRAAAAAVLLFAVGAGTGWFGYGLAQSQETAACTAGIVRQAVGAYAVFSAEKRHPVEVWADKDEQHLVTWLSRRLGHPCKPPPLASLGFHLVGGRLIADNGGPAALYMYEDSAGRRITLYVRRSKNNRDTEFRFAAAGDVEAFYWIDGPLAYAIVGRLDRKELLPIARVVYRSLERG